MTLPTTPGTGGEPVVMVVALKYPPKPAVAVAIAVAVAVAIAIAVAVATNLIVGSVDGDTTTTGQFSLTLPPLLLPLDRTLCLVIVQVEHLPAVIQRVIPAT